MAAGVPEVGLARQTGGRPEVVLIETGPLPDAADEDRPLLGVLAVPWPGPMAVWAGPDETALRQIAQMDTPTPFGLTRSVLRAGPTGRWLGQTLEIDMRLGSLVSQSPQAVLSGANAGFLSGPSGWELIQYQGATLIGEGHYRLNGILRGQAGGEPEAAEDVAPDSVFIPNGPWLQRADLTADEKGLDRLFVAASFREGPAADNRQTLTARWTWRALRLWRPAHLRVLAAPNGDLTFHWVRRSRVGGDDWSLYEVPLEETPERYLIEVWSGQTQVRATETDRQDWTYPAADRLADQASHGALQVRVAQLSPVRGPGAFAEIALT